MSRPRPVVALDGPAGAGKSSVAQQVARELGFVLVDTGALYRGLALAASERDVSWDDGPALGRLAAEVKLGFVASPTGPRLNLDGVDREDAIRTLAMGDGASRVSRHPEVREALLGIQRELGAEGGVVLEGRDIGTVVFPDAEVKIFLTASPAERAKRRVMDLKARGQTADLQEVLAGIVERDTRDSTRPVAPLAAAPDAIHVDTTGLSFEQVVAKVVGLVRERAPSA
ncbi:MAG: (d)CMP kinase [Sandaracinus sp.]|nr:(d)CMP kinase [Sandaracinus sp.]MCB9636703.1 (d)CMP kinase [Sandaracinus sp.]